MIYLFFILYLSVLSCLVPFLFYSAQHCFPWFCFVVESALYYY